MVQAGSPRQLGVGADEAVLRFAEGLQPSGGWAGGRQLILDGSPAFDLSFWCGTCPAMFERLQGAARTLSLEHLGTRLGEGISQVDDPVVAEFGQLLPLGTYVPLLLEVAPQLVRPAEPGDYFAHEQVATWGLAAFWGLPESPHTPYYRTFETAVGPQAHLYEFVVPMVPPSWNDRNRVAQCQALLEQTSTPTAVAVSVLDTCAPATDDRSTDWYKHWMLAHFLLDGHHKFEAAAATGRSLRLLALVSADESLATSQDFENLVDIRRRARQRREP